jgi:type VI secretion system secreted protein VgrG
MASYTNTALSLDRAANNSQFFLKIRTVPDDTFMVTSFTGDKHGLNEDFHFELNLQADAELFPRTVVGYSATLEMRWGSQPLYLHGIISHFERTGETTDAMAYQARLSSPLYPLKLNTNNRVFPAADITSLIDTVFTEAGYEAEEYRIELTKTYPQREFVVQYSESDYDFLLRQLAHYGIFFFFDSDEQRSTLVFSDDSVNRPLLPEIDELTFKPQTGTARTVETVYTLTAQAQLLPGSVRITDYNYRTPDLTLDVTASSSAENTWGEQAIYGDHILTTDEGQEMALIRQQALDVQRETYIAETDCRGIVPGYLLNISKHPSEELNGEYLVISVSHCADQSAALARGDDSKGPTYSNRLHLIKAGTPYRPPVPQLRQVLGLFTARVESSDTEYAYLDEQGRYHIRVDFDRGEATKAQASHPVRLMQPYGGSNFGMHFPLHGGTEVVLACVNGDLDRPVLMGALSNPNTPDVVTSDNNSQNIIRTVSGNELCLDDRSKQERIDLFTAEQKNILTLDAREEAHKIRLATAEGEMEIYAKKTLLMESEDSQHVQSGNDHIITVENAQQLMTRNKEISLQAATDILFKADQNIQFEAEKNSIAMTAEEDLIVDVGNNLSMEVRNDDMTVNVNSGQLSISVAKAISILGQGGGPITIEQGDGTIQISTSGDLTINANTIAINGQSINLKGSKISGN